MDFRRRNPNKTTCGVATVFEDKSVRLDLRRRLKYIQMRCWGGRQASHWPVAVLAIHTHAAIEARTHEHTTYSPETCAARKSTADVCLGDGTHSGTPGSR